MTELYKDGMNAFAAMKAAGHADYPTANNYTHPDDEMVRRRGTGYHRFNRRFLKNAGS